MEAAFVALVLAIPLISSSTLCGLAMEGRSIQISCEGCNGQNWLSRSNWVIIVVFMVLLAKHVQISLQAMRDSRDKKAFFPTPVASHIRTVSPDVAMPEAPQMRRPSPESEGILPEDDTQSSSDESRTIDWSAVANPSLLNVVNQDTLVTTHKPPRLLNDLEGLLSPSKEDKEPPTGSVHRSNSNSSGEGPNALSPKQRWSLAPYVAAVGNAGVFPHVEHSARPMFVVYFPASVTTPNKALNFQLGVRTTSQHWSHDGHLSTRLYRRVYHQRPRV
ncbi:hypothetical protein Y032_0048g1683 [Ancylostoma ceylanicum]|uniref:Uncharacterized protein n=2 Tax=Ancylostoma ceylanicum TaxID=53326 RepID=A0A016UA90_9BILA|nr:hypothetical protein Y032_0048g1683 [Ancylostoma ceylanicum]